MENIMHKNYRSICVVLVLFLINVNAKKDNFYPYINIAPNNNQSQKPTMAQIAHVRALERIEGFKRSRILQNNAQNFNNSTSNHCQVQRQSPTNSSQILVSLDKNRPIADKIEVVWQDGKYQIPDCVRNALMQEVMNNPAAYKSEIELACEQAKLECRKAKQEYNETWWFWVSDQKLNEYKKCCEKNNFLEHLDGLVKSNMANTDQQSPKTEKKPDVKPVEPPEPKPIDKPVDSEPVNSTDLFKDLVESYEIDNINFKADENGDVHVKFGPDLQEEKKPAINFTASINIDNSRNNNNNTVDSNTPSERSSIPTIKDSTKRVLEHNKIDVGKYLCFDGNKFQKEMAERVINNFNMSADLRTEFESKDALVVDACDASMHFSDAGFDAAMKGDAKEAVAYISFSETMFGYAAIKAGKVVWGAAKGVGKGLAPAAAMYQRGDYLGLASYLFPVKVKSYYMIGRTLYDVAAISLTQQGREVFSKACTEFLNSPLEDQVESVAEFVTLLFGGHRKVANAVGLQRGITSLQKVVRREVSSYTSKISKELVPLTHYLYFDKINPRQLSSFKNAVVPRPVAEWLSERQSTLSRALTAEEITTARNSYLITQEVQYTPLYSVITENARGFFAKGGRWKQTVDSAFGGLTPQQQFGVMKKIFDAVKPYKLGGKKFYKHIFLPLARRDGKKGTGWHSARNYPELIQNIKKGSNANGLYEVEWLAPGTRNLKTSTMAPDSWNRVEFMNQLNQGWNNIEQIIIQRPGKLRLIGSDCFGITWEIIIRNESGFNTVTGYPTM